jgi:hypothetical protein
MIAKDLMPWMFVKRTATWTPYAKIRSEAFRFEQAVFGWVTSGHTPPRRPPRGPA